MSTKLEKLLAAYEAERASLTTEMDECVAEMDYGKARLFFKGIARVNQQLQTLYSLHDKWHDAKEGLARSIKFLEERLCSEEECLRPYLAERLAGDKKKLAELSQVAAEKAPAAHAVRDVLHKLLAGEIASFTLVLQNSSQLSCHSRLVRRTVMLTIPEIRRHRAKFTLQKRHISRLKSLGFRLYDNRDKLMLFAPYATVEDVKAIQGILASIAFDIFYFKELAGETFLKYSLCSPATTSLP